jgi:hypothetical protein
VSVLSLGNCIFHANGSASDDLGSQSADGAVQIGRVVASDLPGKRRVRTVAFRAGARLRRGTLAPQDDVAAKSHIPFLFATRGRTDVTAERVLAFRHTGI